MESLETILAMNSKHPPGRRSRSITDLVARVKELEEENKELREKTGRSEKPQEASPAPRSATAASSFDVGAIREIASRGDPIMPGQILALLDYIAELEQRDLKSVIVIENFLQLRDEAKAEVYRLRPIVAAAAAWAGAIAEQNMDAIEAAEREMLRWVDEGERTG